jgi:ketosteroid isomerase-like protein
MIETQMRALARRYLTAMEEGDIDGLRACYAPHAEIWHNTDGRVTTREENLAVAASFWARAPKRRYENRRINVFDGGFVEQHDLHCLLGPRREVSLPVCLVCKVENDLIVRLDEYFDSARLADFRA